jgi:hypothetical protein
MPKPATLNPTPFERQLNVDTVGTTEHDPFLQNIDKGKSASQLNQTDTPLPNARPSCQPNTQFPSLF